MKDGDSIISRLEDSGLNVPRIRLPGSEAPPDTEVTIPFAAAGHHVVDGEIGRGGVGKVLRCRDVDLGREVAMKRWQAYPLFEYGQKWDPPEL